MKFNLENFTGPLDLLISLIEEEKMLISEIALSKITEQYLEYLDKVEEKMPEELADFLVVAARLLLMKSKTLLPQLMPDEDDGPDLAIQLKLYKLFLDASKKVNQLWLVGHYSMPRIEPPHIIVSTTSPANFNINELQKSLRHLLHRLKPPKPLPETTIDKAVSMKEKIDSIRKFLVNAKNANFFSFVNDRNNKTDIIISFLALLELFKQKALTLDQGGAFGDIIIKKV